MPKDSRWPPQIIAIVISKLIANLRIAISATAANSATAPTSATAATITIATSAIPSIIATRAIASIRAIVVTESATIVTESATIAISSSTVANSRGLGFLKFPFKWACCLSFSFSFRNREFESSCHWRRRKKGGRYKPAWIVIILIRWLRS